MNKMTTRSASYVIASTLLLAACSGDDDAGGAAGTGGGSDADHAVPESGTGGHANATGGAGGGQEDSSFDSPNDLDAASDVADGPQDCPSLPEGGAQGDEVTTSESGMLTAPPPATLLATGLYCNIATHTVSPALRYYRPQFQ